MDLLDHDIESLLPETLTPPAEVTAGDAVALETWAKAFPAKMAVVLLGDADDHPLLLATTGNLRAAVQRRMTAAAAGEKTLRIPFHQLVRSVRYRIVYSGWAANLWYLAAARAIYPETYRELVRFPRPNFIIVDLHDAHPRLRRLNAVDDPAALVAGPIAERRAADKLIEDAEDLFDLCRYYDILRQAPHGRACAYKEMEKCPAPCDGSISMEQYRTQLAAAMRFIIDPSEWTSATEQAMRKAATELAFERATGLRKKLVQAAARSGPAYGWMGEVSRMSVVALTPGKGKYGIEPIVIHGGIVTHGPMVDRRETSAAAAIAAFVAAKTQTPVGPTLDAMAIETWSVVMHHLQRGEADSAVILRTDGFSVDSAAAGVAELVARKAPATLMEQDSTDGADAPPATEEPANAINAP